MLSYAANILFFSNLFYGFLKYISIGFVTCSLAKEMIAIAILLLVLTLQDPGSFAFRSSSQIKIAPKRQFCFQAFNPAEMTTTLSVNDLNALKTEAMSHFATKSAEIQFSPTSGGVNNYMDYVVLPSGQKYVLRIYNNGLNSRRVIFEHNILDALNAAGKFSFAIPKAVRSFKTGLTYVTLSNGAEATLFEFIPGNELCTLLTITFICKL